MCRQQLLQHINVRAPRGPGQFDHVDLVQLEQVEQAWITGALHHHAGAWLQQCPHDQVQPMGGPGGGQDQVFIGLDIELLQAPGQLFTQGGQPQRRAVVEQPRHIGAGDLPDRITQVIAFTPALGQPATSQLQRPLRGITALGERVLPPIRVSARVPGCRRWCDKKAGAMPGRQQALGNQALTRFIDAGLAEQVLPRQLAHGRQASPRLHRILSDPAGQRVDDLLHDRHQGLPVDSQLHE